MPPLTVVVSRLETKLDREVVTISLFGELDLASAPALEQQLLDAHASGVLQVVVDLRGLEFIDSAGLHVLLDGQRRLREGGRTVLLRRGPKAVQRMFELSHTDSAFRFED